MSFLIHVTVQKANQQREGTCRSESEARVLKEVGTQTLGVYIYKRNSTVAEWVTLRPTLEVFNRETGYEGGGRHRDLWWRQTVAWKQLSVNLEDILAATRARRWEYGRCDEGGGDREVEESDTVSNGTRYAGTEIGDAQVEECYCVEIHRSSRERGKGNDRQPPRTDIGWRAKKGGVVIRRIAT